MLSERAQRRIERLLDQMDEAADQKDWALVQEHARDVLALDPDNVDARDFLSAAQRRLGQPSDSGSEEDAAPVAVQPFSPTPEADHPTSFANGRYQVKKFLGEGGKKKVFLAHDSLLDRDVAFALIKTEGLDAASRTRITREPQAMGRLGSHPHIVTVFDLGEEQGKGEFETRPYMVTELMGGGDVEGIVEDAPDHRLTLEQAISIAVETCKGLEFAHSKGIVHRDLKPGNVWLTSDGTAKIGDFGLAVATDRSRLTQQGMMVGTVSYMPPEQAMGGEVSPRSDLYSLGAMLYEMVTGRPPFLGDDSVAIIGQHINTPPVAPTWHNSSCPRPLEALIMRLLAKNPLERPGSASDVLTALEAIDVTANVEAPQEAAANVLDSLAGGVFVGRQKEMGELKAALEDGLSGRGRMVTLVGEPGIGKTRTAEELVTYAGLRGCQVLWGRCYEEQGVPPYWPWVQAIRSYVREQEPEQLRSEMGSGAADIAEIVSEVRERLPDLKPSPQLDSPESARFRLFDSIVTFLKGASQGKPLVLVLEDLHWADMPSLLLLEFFTRELTGARLLLVGTYRDVELNRQHPLSETLAQLTRERVFDRILLRGLSEGDVGRFLEVTSGISPPRGLVRAVYTQTEGNPLFVTEVVRLLVQEGELSPEKAGERESWEVRIPEGVKEVVGRRLNRLSQRCNETLTVASVIGREFTLGQLDRLIDDLNQDMLLDVLEEGLSSRVIEEMPTAVGRYQFTHALIQETLVDELSLTRRVRLHARIAEMLEELYADNLEARAAELAHHFAQAETIHGTDKLVRYSMMAGERGLLAYAYEEALGHFQRALASKEGQPMDAETATLLFGLGRAQASTVQLHELQDAVSTLGRAFDYFAEVGDAPKAVAVAEYPVTIYPGITSTNELIARALSLVPPDSPQAGRLLTRYSRALGSEEGDYDGAQKAFASALEIAHRVNDTSLEMRALVESAYVDFFHLRHQECIEKSLKAIELLHGIDDPGTESIAHYLAGFSMRVIDNLEGAQQHAEACLALADKLRNRGLLSLVLALNTIVSIELGNWDKALEFSNRGMVTVPHHGIFPAFRAVIASQLGRLEESKSNLERSTNLAASGVSATYAVTMLAIPIVGSIAGTEDYFDIAEEGAKRILVSSKITPLIWWCASASLALIAIHHRDTDTVAQLYAGLVQDEKKINAFVIHDRLLGLLAHTMGNLDDAQTHFEDALAFCRNAGYRPELAWSLCDYADMLLDRKDEGDREKAMTMLDESLSISTELGMRPLMERVLSRREILKA